MESKAPTTLASDQRASILVWRTAALSIVLGTVCAVVVDCLYTGVLSPGFPVPDLELNTLLGIPPDYPPWDPVKLGVMNGDRNEAFVRTAAEKARILVRPNTRRVYMSIPDVVLYGWPLHATQL